MRLTSQRQEAVPHLHRVFPPVLFVLQHVFVCALDGVCCNVQEDAVYRGTSLIRKPHPPRITIGP
jgi:hypothetical protein